MENHRSEIIKKKAGRPRKYFTEEEKREAAVIRQRGYYEKNREKHKRQVRNNPNYTRADKTRKQRFKRFQQRLEKKLKYIWIARGLIARDEPLSHTN